MKFIIILYIYKNVARSNWILILIFDFYFHLQLFKSNSSNCYCDTVMTQYYQKCKFEKLLWQKLNKCHN